jgi:hypothetical protein
MLVKLAMLPLGTLLLGSAFGYKTDTVLRIRGGGSEPSEQLFELAALDRFVDEQASRPAAFQWRGTEHDVESLEGAVQHWVDLDDDKEHDAHARFRGGSDEQHCDSSQPPSAASRA